METMKPAVFVVDDDVAVRKSLEFLMHSVGLEAATFASAQEFLEACDPKRPGCLVLDIRMPGMSGLELQAKLREAGITLPVIVITGHGDVPVAVQALKGGAMDFIEKPFSKQMLLERIREAIERDAAARSEQARKNHVATRVGGLTPREREVMDQVVAGLSNKEIAAALGVSKKTVEVHRAHVMQKMEADSLADLVEQVIQMRGYARSSAASPFASAVSSPSAAGAAPSSAAAPLAEAMQQD